MTYTIAQLKPLLDFIGWYESKNDYNIVWGGIKAKHRPKLLTRMTIGQVLAWQDGIDPLYMSEAAGKYQIMEDTLRELYIPAGLTSQHLFDEDNQDRLAVALLRRRGLDSYMNGTLSREKFANSLAKEWASLPVVTGPKYGKSYYAGDGLNKAHASVSGILTALDKLKAPTVGKPDTPPAPVKPQPNVGLGTFIAAFFRAFANMFRGN